LHGAHGFLIQNFFSPLYNQRDDEWGGLIENRIRFPLAVVREVRRVIDANATWPFLLGYRVSPEESEPGGLRIGDTYELIERLIEGGINYLHASLSSVLEAKPIDATENGTIAQLLVNRVAGRVPVVAAGQVRTPERAESALNLGLSLVAVGQGLVMNPEWVELAKNGSDDQIEMELKTSKVPDIALPSKLWNVIEATSGWFEVQNEVEALPQRATA
jgi:2,4-dienoyl-CoA reductase-like NADH-dependent reductase (Old Yellow Enzyme family)